MNNSYDIGSSYRRTYPLLTQLLSVMIPIRIKQLIDNGGPDTEDIEQALQLDDFLSIHWNTLLNYLDSTYRNDETAQILNQLAESIAVLAFLDGGVSVFGMNYQEQFPLEDAYSYAYADSDIPLTEDEVEEAKYEFASESELLFIENIDALSEARDTAEATFEVEPVFEESSTTLPSLTGSSDSLPLLASSDDFLPLPLPGSVGGTIDFLLPGSEGSSELPVPSTDLPLPLPGSVGGTIDFLLPGSEGTSKLPVPSTDLPLPLPLPLPSEGENKLLPPGGQS